MKTLTPDGLEWIKYASIDMNIRVFNNKINDILDKQKAKDKPKPLTPKDFAKYDRRVRVKAPTRQS